MSHFPPETGPVQLHGTLDGPQQRERIDPKAMRDAFGSFATGVTIVTTLGSDGRRVGLTANSFSSVSLDPPMVLWCLSKASPNLDLFKSARCHAIGVLAETHRELAIKFSRRSEDKFAHLHWSTGLGGVPLIADALVSFECRNASHHDAGDHVVFLAEVLRISRTSREAPLVFHQSQFVPVAPVGPTTTREF